MAEKWKLQTDTYEVDVDALVVEVLRSVSKSLEKDKIWRTYELEVFVVVVDTLLVVVDDEDFVVDVVEALVIVV
jgi:hypothetical protein